MTNLIGDLRSFMGTLFGGVSHAVLIFPCDPRCS